MAPYGKDYKGTCVDPAITNKNVITVEPPTERPEVRLNRAERRKLMRKLRGVR